MFKPIDSAQDLDSEIEGESIVAEINVTPLVDIFLVLLIIFMVTSSAISQMGVQVQLPTSKTASSSNDPAGVILTLMKEGGIALNGTAVEGRDWEEKAPKLERLLRIELEKTTEKLVVLEGDRAAFLGLAVQVMDAAKRAGAQKFSIATSAGP